jgi:hypothetical protein
MSGTALSYIANAFSILNVYQQGAPIGNPQAQQALLFLNNMLSSWAISMDAPVVAREVWPLVANQATYSWGPGGDFTSSRPSTQDAITGADLILNNALPLDQRVEVPLAVYTDDGYRNVRIKYLPNTQVTGIYYQPTSPLGTLTVWPVPNTTLYTLAVYREQQLGPFADLALTTYYFPDGYDEAILYNLTKRLAGPHGRTMTPDDMDIARTSLANITRANIRMADVSNDMIWGRRNGWYNINTGQ